MLGSGGETRVQKTAPTREPLPRFVVLRTVVQPRFGGEEINSSNRKPTVVTRFAMVLTKKKKETNVLCTQNNGRNYPNKRGEIRINFGVENVHTDFD